MKTDLFQPCGHCWVFQICWHIQCRTSTASSFRIWNSSIGIPSPLLALFLVMPTKARWSSTIVKLLSRVWLFATPWTVVYQAPLSIGFSRQEYWSGFPFPSPGDLPDPWIKPGSPTLQADTLSSEPLGKPMEFNYTSVEKNITRQYWVLCWASWVAFE